MLFYKVFRGFFVGGKILCKKVTGNIRSLGKQAGMLFVKSENLQKALKEISFLLLFVEEQASHSPPPELKRVSEVMWELPTSFKKGMLVPARIIATEELIESMDAGVFTQISNVATLPGIQRYAYCMPDGHFCIVMCYAKAYGDMDSP